ncbi:MAG: formimidoylglutamase [Crocinitomicaceae bacterium]
MKDISIYFKPIENYNQKDQKGFLNSRIQVHTENFFPDIEANDLVLITVPEFRRSNVASENQGEYPNFRKALSELSDNGMNSNVLDLGVLEPGETIDDTCFALKSAVAEILKQQAIPIVVGGSHDLLLPLYQSYEETEQIINICTVDSKIDLGNPSEKIEDKRFLSHLLMHQPGHLFNYSIVGTQTHFLKTEELELFDRLYFDVLRLGEFKSDPKKAEPYIRNADLFNIDLDAMKYSDFQNHDASPNGISSDEICRISRYAGYSDKVSSFGLFGYDSSNDSKLQEANLLAQIVWYFFDGHKQRKKDYPIGSKRMYSKYTVSIQEMKDDIVFYKSDKTERWWLEVPYPPEKGIKFERHYLIPCDYEDYEKASSNELPDLWWKTYRKLI